MLDSLSEVRIYKMIEHKVPLPKLSTMQGPMNICWVTKLSVKNSRKVTGTLHSASMSSYDAKYCKQFVKMLRFKAGLSI